jgi:hypothetical protein
MEIIVLILLIVFANLFDAYSGEGAFMTYSALAVFLFGVSKFLNWIGLNSVITIILIVGIFIFCIVKINLSEKKRLERLEKKRGGYQTQKTQDIEVKEPVDLKDEDSSTTKLQSSKEEKEIKNDSKESFDSNTRISNIRKELDELRKSVKPDYN